MAGEVNLTKVKQKPCREQLIIDSVQWTKVNHPLYTDNYQLLKQFLFRNPIMGFKILYFIVFYRNSFIFK
jgi:protein-S-isoprenylcysteine O-methyltransferase Ste14